MTWHEALREAVTERNLAEHAFMQSDPDFCDYHIYRLHAAEEKVRMIIRQARAAMGYQQGWPLQSPVMAKLSAGSLYDRISDDGEE